MMRKKILIVDDSPFSRQVLVEILHDEYDIAEAGDGLKALEMLSDAPEEYAAVLLDIIMPTMDGYETLSRIRSNEKTADVPVIVSTEHHADAMEVKALALGANDYIVKPYIDKIVKYRLKNILDAITSMEKLIEEKESLRISEEQFRIAAATGDRIIARYDIKSRVYYAGEKALKWLTSGQRIENAPGAIIDMGIISPESVNRYVKLYHEIARGKKVCKADIAFIEASGENSWYQIEATVLLDGDGRPSQAIMVYTDITAQREKDAVYRKWRQSIKQRAAESYTLLRCNLSNGTTYDAVEGELLKVRFSKSAITLNDKALEYANMYVHPKDRGRFVQTVSVEALLADFYRDIKTQTIEYRDMPTPADVRWLRLTVEMVEYPNSTDVEAYLMFEDIDRAKSSEIEVRELAQNDPLTGVNNISTFADRVDQAIENYRSFKHALLMIGLEGFNWVNDTLGRSAGDKALVDIAKSLRGALGQGDLLGKPRGDEFMIFLNCIPVDGAIENKVARICALARRSYGGQARISAKVGIALYPINGQSFKELYQQADAALYSVKTSGKEDFAYYDPSMASRRDGSAATEIQGNGGTDDGLVAQPSEDDIYKTVVERSGIVVVEYDWVGGMFTYDKSISNYIAGNYDSRKLWRVFLSDMVADAKDVQAMQGMLYAIANDRNREDGSMMVKLKTPSGQRRWFEMRVFKFSDERCLAIKLIITFVNVGSRFPAERQIDDDNEIRRRREKAKLLEIITNSVNGGISASAVVDGKVRFLFANDEFFHMLGFTRAQFNEELTNGILDIVHPDDLQKVVDTMDHVERYGSGKVDYRVYRRDGSLIWIRCSSATREVPGVDAPVHIVVNNDITAEIEAADKLRMSEEQFRVAASIGGRVIARYDIKTRTYHHHDEVLLNLGYGEVIENMPEAFIAAGLLFPDSVAGYLDFFDRICRGEKRCAIDSHIKVKEGSHAWIHADATVIFDAAGEPYQAIIVFYDVTEEREKEAVYRKWQHSLAQRPPNTYTLFRSNLSRDASFDSVEGLLLDIEFSPGPASFNDRTLEYAKKRVYPEDQEEYLAFLNSDALLANYYRGVHMKTLEYREIQPGNSLRWLKLTVELVEYPNSTQVEAYLMYEDIDQSKKNELKNKELAETDSLTGVLNRAAFSRSVERMIAKLGPSESLAIMMLDIDGFKLINDTFGHAVGDQVLVDTAKSLLGALRRGDLLGRFGGDEFLICLVDMPDDETIGKRAGQICQLLHRALSAEVYTSASIGIAVCPRDGTDYEELCLKMDTALYAVKAHGKNNYAFYGESMSSEYDTIGALEGGVANLAAGGKKRKLLIVDDSAISLAMLSKLFEDDFTIITAGDGSEALMCMRRHGASIACVLLDLVMPGMDGFQVLEKIRQSPQMATIPVIVVSGMDEHATSLRTIKCGASDFVTKPVDPDLIKLRVQSVISKAENDRLRAQNTILLMHNTQAAKYLAALDSARATAIEYEPTNGLFFYDQNVSNCVAGKFDDRELWEILLLDNAASPEDVSTIREKVNRAVETDEPQCARVTLKTPSGDRRLFRVVAKKRGDTSDFPDRIIITLVDVDGD